MSSVWVQLYYEYEGKNEPRGNLIDIELSDIPNGRISGLVRRLKQDDMKQELDHAGLTEISVYPPESSGIQKKYDSYKEMKEVIAELKTTPPTSGKYPLIVVAPAPDRTQPGQGTQSQQGGMSTSSTKRSSQDVIESLAKKQKIDAPVEQDNVVELNVQKIDLLTPKGHSKVRYYQRKGIKQLHDWLIRPVDDEGKYWNVSLIGHPGAGKSNMMWWIAHDLVTNKSATVLWLGRRETSDDWTACLFEGDCSETLKLQASVEVENLMEHEKLSSVTVLILDAPTVSKTATEHIGNQAFKWALKKDGRRVIHVSSMAAYSLDERVREPKRLKNERMRPWNREDYVESMQDKELKKQVCVTLDLPETTADEVVVDSKLFYSGINARWFFNYTIEEIKCFCNDICERLSKDSVDANAAKAAVNSAFCDFRGEDRKIKLYTSEYLAFVMGSDMNHSSKFFEAFPLMKNRLGNGTPGEIFEADFLVNLEHCHGLAQAEAYFLGTCRDLNVSLGRNLQTNEKELWPVGTIKELPKNPSKDILVAQPIGMKAPSPGLSSFGVLWFVPEDKNQPFLDFFVLIPNNNDKWELRIIQNTTSKRHEKKTDEDQLIRVLVGLEAAGFDLEASIVVAYVVESVDQNEVGKGLDGKSIKLPIKTGTVAEKEFNISVHRIVYQRRASTLASSVGKKPEAKTH